MMSSAARSACLVTSSSEIRRTWSVSGTGLALWTRSSSLSIRTRTSIGTSVSSAAELFLQPGGDIVWHEIVDVPAERGQLLDTARAQEAVLRGGHQVDGL